MPSFEVSRSIRIKAPIEKVFQEIRDFTTWPKWSPWLIADPGCSVRFADDGTSYSWDGDVAGSGRMSIRKTVESHSILCDLQFLKPWKSSAKVQFELEPSESGTKVNWSIQSALPFFMFFMKPMMVGLIGMDYERGLAMLKDEIETGTVPSELDFGKAEISAQPYVGIRNSCAVMDLGESMQADFAGMGEWLGKTGTDPSGPPFSIYHKWDVVKARAEYILGFPVSEPVADLPRGMEAGMIPAMAAYTVRHTGPYRHLANAWAAGLMRSRSGVFKQSRIFPPFEIYENDPKETPENDLVTTVHFPMK